MSASQRHQNGRLSQDEARDFWVLYIVISKTNCWSLLSEYEMMWEMDGEKTGGVWSAIWAVSHFQEWALLTVIAPPPTGFLRHSKRKLMSSAGMAIMLSSSGIAPSLPVLALPAMMIRTIGKQVVCFRTGLADQYSRINVAISDILLTRRLELMVQVVEKDLLECEVSYDGSMLWCRRQREVCWRKAGTIYRNPTWLCRGTWSGDATQTPKRPFFMKNFKDPYHVFYVCIC